MVRARIDVVMAKCRDRHLRVGAAGRPEAFKRLMDINVVGVFNTVRVALPSVIERRGYVLVVSSLGPPHGALRRLGARVLDRHADDPRRQVRPAEPRGTAEHIARPGEQDHLGGQVRRGVRQGIEGRKRRVNCPRWVGLFRWLRPLLSTPVGEAQFLKSTPDGALTRIDAEVAALGRSTSARTRALQRRA